MRSRATGRRAGARNTLQVYVSSLRRLLGRAIIETTPSGYRLSVASGSVDAERFEQLFRDRRAALMAGDADGALATLSEGLAMRRGHALADLRHEAFARAKSSSAS